MRIERDEAYSLQVYVEPGVTFLLGERAGVEITVPVSVLGRNWPAGPVLNVSFLKNGNCQRSRGSTGRYTASAYD